jgi:hypothetical protein
MFENSMEAFAPHLIKELHPTKNGCFSLAYLSPSSTTPLWWVCKCGNEWKANAGNRARLGVGCPKCGNKRKNEATRGKLKPIKIEDSIAYKAPELIKYWHPTKNGNVTTEMVGTGSERIWWWLCERGHESEGRVYHKLDMTRNNAPFPCKNCLPLNKKIPKPGNSFADKYPDIAKYWHPTMNGDLTPFDVTPHANDYVYWLCSKGHTTSALINSKAGGYTCGECKVAYKSKIEGMFRNAFRDSGLLTDVPEGNHKITLAWKTNKTMGVDIFGYYGAERIPVFIEYDGEYWHQYPKSAAHDLAKSEALVNSGRILIRIREHALPFVALTHDNLFQINHDFSPRYSMRDADNILITVTAIKEWLEAKFG